MTYSLFDLGGRTALITGAGGYLGSEMARALASAGAHVILNGRDADKCEALKKTIIEAEGSAETAIFDVTDDESVNEFFDKRGQYPLHILINNAHNGMSGTIETSEPRMYAESYDVALISAHRMVSSALGCLREAVHATGDASVINVASMYGMVSPDLKVYPEPGSSNPPFYGAAKAALIQWSRYAGCEFGHEGIRINSISPGAFPAKSVQKNSPEFIQTLSKKVPMGRIGQAGEITGPVVFLASTAASYINGSNLVVDGGWTAW